MRTFYIFKVNREYYNLTKDMPFNLYKAYLNIKVSTKENLRILSNEYYSFTERFDKKSLNEFIFNRYKDNDCYNCYGNTHMFNNYYTDEVSKLIVNNSFMILKCNVPNSSFLSVLVNIPYLFIIDFEKEDFFWLSNLKNLRVVYDS